MCHIIKKNNKKIMGNNKLVDITGLSRYHEKLKGLLNEKQDVIDDLDAIRSGAAAGAGAGFRIGHYLCVCAGAVCGTRGRVCCMARCGIAAAGAAVHRGLGILYSL